MRSAAWQLQAGLQRQMDSRANTFNVDGPSCQDLGLRPVHVAADANSISLATEALIYPF